MKKVLKIMKVICTVFLCMIFVMPVVIYAVNNKIASDAADDILSLPLPENTEFIEKNRLRESFRDAATECSI